MSAASSNRRSDFQLDALEPRVLLSAVEAAASAAPVTHEAASPIETATQATPAPAQPSTGGLFDGVPAEELSAAASTPQAAAIAAPFTLPFLTSGADQPLQLPQPLAPEEGTQPSAVESVETLRAANGPPLEALAASFDSGVVVPRTGDVSAAASAPARPLLLVPGIGGTLSQITADDDAATKAAYQYWLVHRGLDTSRLQVDPLLGVYDLMIESAENLGYKKNIDFFVVNYDWRVAPGPEPNNAGDQAIDGHIDGLTAGNITDSRYDYGVDYLGHYLQIAAQAWKGAHGVYPDSVDVIAHSTGGVVTRVYIQSDAYGGRIDPNYSLPKVHDFVMMGVPNRGVSKAWNSLLDDWSLDDASKLVLSKIVDGAYQAALNGATISGPDGDIVFGPTPMSHAEFIQKYCPTIRGLLATYAFLDTSGAPPGGTLIPHTVNTDLTLRNTLLLDLNNGLDLFYTMEQLDSSGRFQGREPLAFARNLVNGGRVIDIYSATSSTTAVMARLRSGAAGDENKYAPFDRYVTVKDAPNSSRKTYEDIKNGVGDGTVPAVSARDLFTFLASRYSNILTVSLTVGRLDWGDVVDHTGMMGARAGQQAAFGAIMGGNFDASLLAVNSPDPTFGLAGDAGAFFQANQTFGVHNRDVIKSAPLSPDDRAGLQLANQKGSVAAGKIVQDPSASGGLFAQAAADFGLNTKLPILDQSLQSLFNFDTILSVLTGALGGKLRETTPLTTEDILTWIERAGSLPDLPSGLEFSVDPTKSFGGSLLANMLGIASDPTRADEIAFLFHIEVDGSKTLAISFGSASTGALKVSLDADATIRANLHVEFDLLIGVRRAPGLALADRAYFNLSGFVASVDAQVTDLNAGIQFGFLGADINNGKFNLHAQVQIKFFDPNGDGIITVSELDANPVISTDPAKPGLVALLFSGTLDARLPIQIDVKGLPVPGVAPTLLVTDANLFDANLPSVSFDPSSDISLITEFQNPTTDNIVSILQKLVPYVGELIKPYLRNIPVIGPELSRIVTVSERIPDLVAKFRAAQDADTIQEFNDALKQFLSDLGMPDEVTVKLGPTGDLQIAFMLVEDVSESHTFTIQKPIQVAGQPVATLSVDADIKIEGSVTLELVIGVPLNANPVPYLVPVPIGPDNKPDLTADGTKVVISLRVANDNPIDAAANLGFLGDFEIKGGHVILGAANGRAPPADGDRILDGFSIVDPVKPATLSLVLNDPNNDKKIAIDELAATISNVTNSIYCDAAFEIILPFKPLDGMPDDARPLVAIFLPDPCRAPLTWVFRVQDADLYLEQAAVNVVDPTIDLLQRLGDRLVDLASLPNLNVVIPFLDLDPHKLVGDLADALRIFFHDIAKGNGPGEALDDVIAQAADAAFQDANLAGATLRPISTDPADWAPSQGRVRFLLHFAKQQNLDVPFALAGGVFALDGKFQASISLLADVEFGYNPDVGLYLVDRGANDPNGEVSVAVDVSTTGLGLGGHFGPLAFGVLDGKARIHFSLGLDLKAPGTDKRVAVGSLGDAQSLSPLLLGQAALYLPIGLRLGNGGPGVTTTFGAAWDASHADTIFFPNQDLALPFVFPDKPPLDPAQGFGPIRFETGEFLSTLIKPFLERIQKYNPISPEIADFISRLYEPLPILDKSPMEVLDFAARHLPNATAKQITGLLSTPALRLLIDIAKQLSDLSSLTGLDVAVDLSKFNLTGEKTPSKPGQPTESGGNTGSDNAISSFLQRLRDYYGVEIPILDPSKVGQTIIGLILQRDLPVISWKPPTPLELKVPFDFPAIPLIGYGVPEVAEVSINLIYGGSITFYANPEFGISTRGFYKKDNSVVQSVLDGFYIGDNKSDAGDAFEVGITFEAYGGLSGTATVLGFDLAEIYGQLALQAKIGIDVADISSDVRGDDDLSQVFINDGTKVVRVGRNDPHDRGDGRVNWDEILALGRQFPITCILTPGGSLVPKLTIGVRAGGVGGEYLLDKILVEKEFPAIFNYNFPCKPPPPPNLADIRNGVLEMLDTGSNEDGDITVSLERNEKGEAIFLRLNRTFKDRSETERFSLTDPNAGTQSGGATIGGYVGRLADGNYAINGLIVRGTNGKNKISVEPAVLTEPRLHIVTVEVHGAVGDDSIFLGKFDPAQTSLEKTGFATRIFGEAGNDQIEGTPLRDYIDGGAGDDTVDGYAGADEIHGGLGKDLITGGTGADAILGDEDHDTIYGLEGDDLLEGGVGDDWIYGNIGSDTITDAGGNNIIFGDSGSIQETNGVPNRATSVDLTKGEADSVRVTSGVNILVGGSGDDSLTGGTGTNYFVGDNADIAFVSAQVSKVDSLDKTENGDDKIFGNSGRDFALGGAGKDEMHGGGGDDVLIGDLGSMSFQGASLTLAATAVGASGGDDKIFGEDGNDILLGGSGVDAIEGGTGNDWILGDNGSVTVASSTSLASSDSALGGVDSIVGGLGNDLIIAGAAGDTVSGGTGDDTAVGADDDVIIGDFGQITVTGGVLTSAASTDAVVGDRDILQGNSGNDLLIGGAGRDDEAGGLGDDILFGDGGRLSIGSTTTAATTDAAIGDNDTLTGGLGMDLLFGGAGQDTLTGGVGNDVAAGEDTDVIFGDFGTVTSSGGKWTKLESGDPTLGDIDTIKGNAGGDYIFGGLGSDLIDGGPDNDVILGDVGTVEFDAASSARAIKNIALGSTADGGARVKDFIQGGAGNDTIFGEEGEDELYGDSGNDEIHGNSGMDRIWGGDGDDRITGDEANDLVHAGAGNDQVDGGAGDDLLFGEEGNDTISGGAGSDRAYGGLGDDLLYGTGAGAGSDSDADYLFGEEGNDTIYGQGGDDQLYGAEGVDEIHGGTGNDLLVAGTGVGDRLYGEEGNDRIFGSDEGALSDSNFEDATRFGDYIEGNDGDDEIQGLGGADYILGGAGNDRIDSGIGADLVKGGDGDDWIFAGHGAGDTILGEKGADTIYGSHEGDDSLNGGDDIDQIFGQGGNDTIYGGAGDDYINGGAGTDKIFGEDGADEIDAGGGAGDQADGGNGADVIYGSDDGADQITGGAGDDIIFGKGGNDQLLGGDGNDRVHGGPGDDRIEGGNGSDILLGEGGHDSIYGNVLAASISVDEVDYLYGDYGTNGNEADAGRDRLFGLGGNDLLYGEGGDDFIDPGTGGNALIDYGAGEGAVASDYVQPARTADPSIAALGPNLITAPSALPSGTVDPGRWSELMGSATSSGLSGDAGLSIEPALASGSNGTIYTAWVDSRSGNFEIYVARFTPGQGWSELSGSASEGGISQTAATSRRPSVAVDSTGAPVVAWTEFNGSSGDIVAARWTGSAWTRLGGTSLSSSGLADSVKLANTPDGMIAVWIDRASGSAALTARQLRNGSWAALGGSISGAGGNVTSFALATNGSRAAVAWSQPGTGSSEIFAREYVNGAWNELAGSATGGGLSKSDGASVAPSVAYFNNTIFIAWQDFTSGFGEINAAQWNGAAWSAAGADGLAANGISRSNGNALQPVLTSGGSSLTLFYLTDRAENRQGTDVVVYARRWNGSAFTEQVQQDAALHGISPTGGLALSAAAATDSDGHPFFAWTEIVNGNPEIYLRANLFTATRTFTTSATLTLQAILDQNDLGPGDLVIVAGPQGGIVQVAADDSGALIYGLDQAGVAGLFTLYGASQLTIQRLALNGGVTIRSGDALTLREDAVTRTIDIRGGNNHRFAHNTLSAVTVNSAAANPVFEYNTTQVGADFALDLRTAGIQNLLFRFNRISSGANGIRIGAASDVQIHHNDIQAAATGLSIEAAATGSIDHNKIHGAGTGVSYRASAPLNSNDIYDNGTGVDTSIDGTTAALGFLPNSKPNEIYRNNTGITVTGRVQGQHLFANQTGVSGSGIIGPVNDFAWANVIERNQTGVSGFKGIVQFNKFIGNQTSIAATEGQLIVHNTFYRDVTAGITVSVARVQIFQNTLYSVSADAIHISSGADDVEIRNNILWTENGTDIIVDNIARSGFYSDYNDLYAGDAGTLVWWAVPFKDILDWQADVARFDLHSIGRTVVNPGWARPRFLSLARGDLRIFDLAAGQRFSSPTIDEGSAFIDKGLPVTGYNNLLLNPGFENGLTSWTANPDADNKGAEIASYEGTRFFYAGKAPLGYIEQTVNLLSAGFSAAQLDSKDYVIVFGGRTRSGLADLPDKGMLILTFLNAAGQAIGDPVVLHSDNPADRWDLTGARAHMPAGTRQAKLRFEALRADDNTEENLSLLDSAFLYVLPDSVMPNLGADGNNAGESAQRNQPHLQILSPDLYVDWETNKPHVIRWDSFGNDNDGFVRIDLYQDLPNGPVLLTNIAARLEDLGSFTWIPANSGIGYGVHGLRVQISLTTDNLTLDRSSEAFATPENTNTFYVNDGSRQNDEYTLAVGSNRNTGKLASAPKPNPVNVLRIYGVGANQTVYVDTGDYLLHYTLLASNRLGIGDDEGFTLTGPQNTSRVARLHSANPTELLPLLEVNGADFVSLQHLSADSGLVGLWLHDNSESFQGSYLTLSSNKEDGVRIEPGSAAASLDHLVISGNKLNGLKVEGAATRVSDSSFSGNAELGIFINTAQPSLLERNTVTSNVLGGIDATGPVIVRRNVVSQHRAPVDDPPLVGIRVSGASTAIENISFSNDIGIDASQDGTGPGVAGNRVYNNRLSGLVISGNMDVIGNVSDSNDIGIEVGAGYSGKIANNLVYANAHTGVLIRAHGDDDLETSFVNNTVYQLAGDAVQVTESARNVHLRNNILWTNDRFDLFVAGDSQAGFQSDYNLFWTSGSGRVGSWQGADQRALGDWQNAAFTDRHSIAQNPLFVDPDGADNILGGPGRDDDFHLQSAFGSMHGGALAAILDSATNLPVILPGALANDAGRSPGIDRGDAQDSAAGEPVANGGYVNLGFEGGTTQASRSAPQYVLVLSPDGGESAPAGRNLTISWRSHDSQGTVTLELWTPGGAASTLTIARDIQNTGQFVWKIPQTVTPGNYLVKVVRGAVSDLSNAIFAIAAPVTVFYVNDGSFASGDWTTAPGANQNSGFAPAAPMASIRAVLEKYELGPGDVIRVDAGSYSVSANIVITAADAGVTIEGYHDATFPSRAAALNRGNAFEESYLFELQGAAGVTLRNLKMSGAAYSVFASSKSPSPAVKLIANEMSGNSLGGIHAEEGNDAWQITGNIVTGQGSAPDKASNTGISYVGNNAAISGNTVSRNLDDGIYVSGEKNVLSQNDSFDNGGHGILLISPENATSLATVSQNTVHQNGQQGIWATGPSLVSGNTVYGQAKDFGIEIAGGNAFNNVIYQNQDGLLLGPNAKGESNRIFANSGAGIVSGDAAQILSNKIYQNQKGISLLDGFDGVIRNNIIYANTAAEVALETSEEGASLNASIENNTFYVTAAPTALLLRGYLQTAQVRNNIFVLRTGQAFDVSRESQPAFLADYNLYAFGAGTKVATWGTRAFLSRVDWYYELGYDANSVEGDPLFLDADGADNALGYDAVGRVDHGGDDDFRVQSVSPAVDTGDPASPFALEPAPNGGRIEIGAFGNTAQAAKSPAQSIRLLAPNIFQKLQVGSPATLEWQVSGLTGSSGTVELALSLDRGATFAVIAPSVSVNAQGKAAFAFTPTAPSDNAQFRLRLLSGGTAQLVSPSFVIANAGHDFYLNDDAFSAGDWTTAAGNNAFSGKDAAHPMSSLVALLKSYRLETGDVIHIDVGNYQVFQNIVVGPELAGVRIEGYASAQAPTRRAVLNRGNTTLTSYLFELGNVSNFTVANLNLTGAGTAIHALAEAEGQSVLFSGNEIFGNAQSGVDLRTERLQARLQDNKVHDDGLAGIFAAGPVVLNGNAVYNFSAEGAFGIRLEGGASLENSRVYSNTTGVLVDGAGRVSGNAIYNNSRAITVLLNGDQTVIEENRIYSNNVGIVFEVVRYSGEIRNNILYAQSESSILLDDADLEGARIANNDFLVNGGAAIVARHNSLGLALENNIFVINAGAGISIAADSQRAFQSDYNFFQIKSGAKLGIWQAVEFIDRVTWSLELGFDDHGLEGDPRFVNADGADNQLGFNRSSNTDFGADDDFHLQSASPAIDSGNPSSSFANEPAPNGGRIDQGAYGNKAGATRSTAQFVRVLTPNGFEKLEAGQTYPIRWQVFGIPSATAKIELSLDNGASWTMLSASASSDSNGVGTFAWTPLSQTTGNVAKIRVTMNEGTKPLDTSDAGFLITNGGRDFYLNDKTFAAGDLTTAAGNMLNSGKDPSQPLGSLFELFHAYDLDPGDVVHIDRGGYEVIRNAELWQDDSGVRIEGAAGAVLARNNIYNESAIFDLRGADNVTISNLQLTTGWAAIFGRRDAESNGLTVQNSILAGNHEYGVFLDLSNDRAAITDNVVNALKGGSSDDDQRFGIVLESFDNVVARNRVFDHLSVGIQTDGANNTVRQNETYGNSIGIRAFYQGPGEPDRILGNKVHDNLTAGIDAHGKVIAQDNDVYGQINSNAAGISASSETVITGNRVYKNFNGITAIFDALIDNNSIFANKAAGIVISADPTVQGNRIYSNAIGISSTEGTSALIQSNLLYSNANFGIYALSGGGEPLRILNNTIVQPVGNAVRIEKDSQGVVLSNNIFSADSGAALRVAGAEELGRLKSDYNLFNIGADANALAGLLDTNPARSLADWQRISSRDAHSLSGAPLFVDADGADNVLGYSPAGLGYDGGPDDNFELSKGSPAIDRGDPWNAAGVDALGLVRRDDPGTPNAGAADYAARVLSSNLFTRGGTAQKWQGDGFTWELPLGFEFQFYGLKYHELFVSSQGYVDLENYSENPQFSSTSELGSRIRIAPLWDSIATTGAGDDIFIDTTVANEVTIRWDATNLNGGGDVNFAVTLFADGRIRFDYGAGNSGLTPVVGISRGNFLNNVLSDYSTRGNLASANSLEFALSQSASFVDLGAYEFRGSSLDAQAPTVTGSNPAGVHQPGPILAFSSSIKLNFSEELNPIDANAATSYELRSQGANGIIGDADDVIYILKPSYLPGTTTVTLKIEGPELVSGSYRLTLFGDRGLHDLSGNRLDGDANGQVGGDYIRQFRFAGEVPEVVFTNINQGAAQRSTISSVAFTFNTNVAGVSASSFVVLNQLTNASIPASQLKVVYDAATRTATLSFPGVPGGKLGDGAYLVTLKASGVTNVLGASMTDDFALAFTALAGDLSGDGTTNDLDLFSLWRVLRKPSGQRDLAYDLNGDGQVSDADLDFLKNRYLTKAQPAPQNPPLFSREILYGTEPLIPFLQVQAISPLDADPLLGDKR